MNFHQIIKMEYYVVYSIDFQNKYSGFKLYFSILNLDLMNQNYSKNQPKL